MNKPLFSLIAGSMLATLGCHQPTSPVVSPTPVYTLGRAELRVSAPFANQTAQFAFDLANRVARQTGTSKNMFISPLSLHMALGMLLNGASGQTASEIQQTLKLDAQTLSEANTTYKKLLTNLPGLDPQETLRLGNSVWYRQSFTVLPAYQDLLKQTFNATISAEDFDSPATVGKINAWASQQTQGKIPQVIQTIQPENVLFVLNALYVKGTWKTQFVPSLTYDAPFTTPSGVDKMVRMMRQKTSMRRAFRDGYAAFELPYGNDQYAMTILLPAPNGSADALLQRFSASEWTQLQQNMTVGSMDIGLPKFTLRYEAGLNSILSDMGMPTAFSTRADFTRMNAAGGLTLSFVKQHAFISVDEQGTEAAAVTTGGVSTTSVQMPTLCDRPFVFVIHEKNTNTILFVGKIADPTQIDS